MASKRKLHGIENTVIRTRGEERGGLLIAPLHQIHILIDLMVQFII